MKPWRTNVWIDWILVPLLLIAAVSGIIDLVTPYVKWKLSDIDIFSLKALIDVPLLGAYSAWRFLAWRSHYRLSSSATKRKAGPESSPASPIWWRTAAKLTSENSGLRWNAACYLARKGDPRATDELIHALSNMHHRQQGHHSIAIRLLGELGDSRAVPPLLDFLEKSAYRNDIDEAIEALNKLQNPTIRTLITAARRCDFLSQQHLTDCEQFTALVHQLADMKSMAIPALEQLFHEVSVLGRSDILTALLTMGGGDSQVLDLLRQSTPRDRARLVYLLHVDQWGERTPELQNWINEAQIERSTEQNERRATNLTVTLLKNIPQSNTFGTFDEMHTAAKALQEILELIYKAPEAFLSETLRKLREIPESARYVRTDWDKSVDKELSFAELHRAVLHL